MDPLDSYIEVEKIIDLGRSVPIDTPFGGSNGAVKTRIAIKGFNDDRYHVACYKLGESPAWYKKFLWQKIDVNFEGKAAQLWVNTNSLKKRFSQSEKALTVFKKFFPESFDLAKSNLKALPVTEDQIDDMLDVVEQTRPTPGVSIIPKHQHRLARTVLSLDNAAYFLESCHSSKGDVPLGKGSFGKVVVGSSLLNKESRIAVKILRVKDKKSELVVAREIAIMKKLKGCNHIVQFYGHTSVNDQRIKTKYTQFGKRNYSIGTKYYIAMEKCDKEALIDRISDGTLFHPTVVEELLEGLREIHDRKIVHSDIKLENILLKDGHVKIGDFGLAFEEGDRIQRSKFSGSLLYLPPEVAAPKTRRTQKMDIWAMGCMLYMLLTEEQLSFQKEMENEIQKKDNNLNDILDKISILSDQAKIDAEIDANAPEEYRNLLKAMLRIKPEERCTAAQAILFLK